MAAERRERRLDARQRRAQLVSRVRREAPCRRERALAVGRRAAQAGEHLVEARGQRAQLRRAVVARHAAIEILGAGDPRRRGPEPPQRPEHEIGGQPDAEPGDQQRPDAEREQAAVERRQLALGGAELRRDLERRETAERLELDRVGAIALAAHVERLQAQPRRRPSGGQLLAERRQLAAVEQEAQRRPRGRQHVVEPAVGRGQLALHRRERRLAGELGGPLQPEVQRRALGVADVARHDDARRRPGRSPARA